MGVLSSSEDFPIAPCACSMPFTLKCHSEYMVNRFAEHCKWGCDCTGVEKGSGNPSREKVGEVTVAQLKEIAETKLPDLNCSTVEAAMETVKGTARNMGITVADE